MRKPYVTTSHVFFSPITPTSRHFFRQFKVRFAEITAPADSAIPRLVRGDHFIVLRSFERLGEIRTISKSRFSISSSV